MKLFLSALAAFAVAAGAQASPAVGDSVTFKGTWGEEAIEQTLAFTAYNEATKQFTQVTVTSIGSAEPAAKEDLVDYDATASDEALQAFVDGCEANGYVPETLTVAAGIFPTCKAPMTNGGFVYIGVVPFGVVRMDTVIEEKPLLVDLVSVNRGQ